MCRLREKTDINVSRTYKNLETFKPHALGTQRNLTSFSFDAKWTVIIKLERDHDLTRKWCFEAQNRKIK